MAYRSITAAAILVGGTGGAAIDPGKPAGFAATDLLVANLFGVSGVITPPTGWTLIDRAENGLASYWAIGSVASTSFTVATNGTNDVSVLISAWTGRNTTTPIAATAYNGAQTTAATQIDANSVTAAAGGDILIYEGDFSGNVAFGAPPAGYTEIYGADPAGGATINWYSIIYKDNVTGATGVVSRTAVALNYKSAATIALAASGGAPPESVSVAFIL